MDDAYHYLKSRGIKGYHNTQKIANDGSPNSEADSGVRLSPFIPDISTRGYLSGDDIKPPRLFVWSSQDQSGIDRLRRSYATYLRTKGKDSLEENILERLAYTLSTRRSVLAWRTFCVASSVEEICDALECSMPKPVRSSGTPKIGFVFTGQGAQYQAMGRTLMSYQVFRSSLRDAGAYLNSIGCSWSLLGMLQSR